MHHILYLPPQESSAPSTPGHTGVPDAGPAYMNARELAAFLGISLATVSRRKRDGTLPHVRIGRRVLFDPAAVRDALTATAEVRP